MVGCQNRITNGRVMPMQRWGKSGVKRPGLLGAENWLFWPYFWRYGLQIFLTIIYINIKGQTQLEVNWTQIKHFVLLKYHYKGRILKRHFGQSSKLPSNFWILGSKLFSRPKSKFRFITHLRNPFFAPNPQYYAHRAKSCFRN